MIIIDEEIKDSHSGIRVALPPGWSAYSVGEGRYLIAFEQEHGILYLAIHDAPIANYLPVDQADEIVLQNPITGEDAIAKYDIMTGYHSFIYEDIFEKKFLQEWVLHSGKYIINFVYICTKPDKRKERSKVLKIINSVQHLH